MESKPDASQSTVHRFFLWASWYYFLSGCSIAALTGLLTQKMPPEGAIWVGLACLLLAFLYLFGWVGLHPRRREAAVAAYEKNAHLFVRDFDALRVFASAPALAFILIGTACLVPFAALFSFFWSTTVASPPLWAALLLSSFVGSLIFVCGFLFVAELYQRKVASPPRNIFVDFFTDLLFAFPLICLIAIVWTLLLLARVKKRRSAGHSFFPLFLLQGLNVYVMLNLSSIALHERRWNSYRDVLALLRSEAGSIAHMSIFSGSIFLPIIMWCMAVGFWQPTLQLSNGTLAALIGWPFFITVIAMWSVTQMNFLMFMAKHRSATTA